MLREKSRPLGRGGIVRWREPTLVLASPIKFKLSVGIRTRLLVAVRCNIGARRLVSRKGALFNIN